MSRYFLLCLLVHAGLLNNHDSLHRVLTYSKHQSPHFSHSILPSLSHKHNESLTHCPSLSLLSLPVHTPLTVNVNFERLVYQTSETAGFVEVCFFSSDIIVTSFEITLITTAQSATGTVATREIYIVCIMLSIVESL